MRISDWSSDVCSSDLASAQFRRGRVLGSLLVHPELGGRRSGGGERSHESHDGRGCGEFAHVCPQEIGRASCRERVCQYVSISVVAVSLKKKKIYAESLDQAKSTD